MLEVNVSGKLLDSAFLIILPLIIWMRSPVYIMFKGEGGGGHSRIGQAAAYRTLNHFQ